MEGGGEGGGGRQTDRRGKECRPEFADDSDDSALPCRPAAGPPPPWRLRADPAHGAAGRLGRRGGGWAGDGWVGGGERRAGGARGPIWEPGAGEPRVRKRSARRRARVPTARRPAGRVPAAPERRARIAPARPEGARPEQGRSEQELGAALGPDWPQRHGPPPLWPPHHAEPWRRRLWRPVRRGRDFLQPGAPRRPDGRCPERVGARPVRSGTGSDWPSLRPEPPGAQPGAVRRAPKAQPFAALSAESDGGSRPPAGARPRGGAWSPRPRSWSGHG